MEDWLKVIFSGIGSNIVTFILGLLVGGGAVHGIEVRQNKIRAEKGQVATEIAGSSEVEQSSKKDGGPQVVSRVKGKSKVKQVQS